MEVCPARPVRGGVGARLIVINADDAPHGVAAAGILLAAKTP